MERTLTPLNETSSSWVSFLFLRNILRGEIEGKHFAYYYSVNPKSDTFNNSYL